MIRITTGFSPENRPRIFGVFGRKGILQPHEAILHKPCQLRSRQTTIMNFVALAHTNLIRKQVVSASTKVIKRRIQKGH